MATFKAWYEKNQTKCSDSMRQFLQSESGKWLLDLKHNFLGGTFDKVFQQTQTKFDFEPHTQQALTNPWLQQVLITYGQYLPRVLQATEAGLTKLLANKEWITSSSLFDMVLQNPSDAMLTFLQDKEARTDLCNYGWYQLVSFSDAALKALLDPNVRQWLRQQPGNKLTVIGRDLTPEAGAGLQQLLAFTDQDASIVTCSRKWDSKVISLLQNPYVQALYQYGIAKEGEFEAMYDFKDNLESSTIFNCKVNIYKHWLDFPGLELGKMIGFLHESTLNDRYAEAALNAKAYYKNLKQSPLIAVYNQHPALLKTLCFLDAKPPVAVKDFLARQFLCPLHIDYLALYAADLVAIEEGDRIISVACALMLRQSWVQALTNYLTNSKSDTKKTLLVSKLKEQLESGVAYSNDQSYEWKGHLDYFFDGTLGTALAVQSITRIGNTELAAALESLYGLPRHRCYISSSIPGKNAGIVESFGSGNYNDNHTELGSLKVDDATKKIAKT